MISLHPARHGAERFDSLVEGGRRDNADPRTSDLLELVGALRSVPEAQARPEFVLGLRERLMLAADTELSATPVRTESDALSDRLTVAPRRTPRERRLAVVLGGFAIVGATTSMAVAAQGSLPGDALYPLKRAIEDTRAGVSVGDEAKGSRILDNATGRLDEVDELTRDGDGDSATVEQTLNTFSDQASEASELLIDDYSQSGDEGSINELRDFTVSSIGTLSALEVAIPDGAEAALLNAAHVLFTIDAAAGQACPTCSSPGITEIPSPLLASGTAALDQANTTLSAGSELTDSADPSLQSNHPTDEASQPSGLEAPTDPVTLPTAPPTTPSGVPSAADPSPDVTGSGLPGIGVGVGGGNASDGRTKKPKPVKVPVVDDVVDDVIQGVNDALNGLAGGIGPRPAGQ